MPRCTNSQHHGEVQNALQEYIRRSSGIFDLRIRERPCMLWSSAAEPTIADMTGQRKQGFAVVPGERRDLNILVRIVLLGGSTYKSGFFRQLVKCMVFFAAGPRGEHQGVPKYRTGRWSLAFLRAVVDTIEHRKQGVEPDERGVTKIQAHNVELAGAPIWGGFFHFLLKFITCESQAVAAAERVRVVPNSHEIGKARLVLLSTWNGRCRLPYTGAI
ncbi:uncharacterized protein LOC144095591 [Amblyomma americanum]